MPPLINHLLEDLENDGSTVKDSVINHENNNDETSRMINTDNTNINQESIVIFSSDKFSSRSKIVGSINIRWAYLFLFVLLTIIGFGILIFFVIKNFIYINHLETFNNQYIETITQLNNRIIQLETKENFPTPTNLNQSKQYGIKIKWKPNAVTISAVNGLNRLHSPLGIYIDDDSRSIYVASWGRHCIVGWKFNETIGEIVAGSKESGNGINQLHYPTDLIVDKETNSLIICDEGNRRIVQWFRQNRTNPQIIIPHIYCARLIIDRNGDFYVSDWFNNKIIRWNMVNKEGTIVAGGNGNGNQSNQLSSPRGVFVDQDFSVYVADLENHRIMKWTKNAKEGIVVAGGNGEGNNLTQLRFPEGVIVDHFGNVYVADTKNKRIMRWNAESQEGSIILSGDSIGQQSNSFEAPGDISFDGEGNLYVVDYSNRRIQNRSSIMQQWFYGNPTVGISPTEFGQCPNFTGGSTKLSNLHCCPNSYGIATELFSRRTVVFSRIFPPFPNTDSNGTDRKMIRKMEAVFLPETTRTGTEQNLKDPAAVKKRYGPVSHKKILENMPEPVGNESA
ncbi:unnamed protein product [Adineta ricciae]|uniref:Uncharacterized protein n=1 Tax=Adineta ricciae TaxID=249248 RepID=A0A815IH63_ADIRI|nr:unnamed protein product [Adineta ricciae]